MGSLFGLAFLFAVSPSLASGIRLAGAEYLIFAGVQRVASSARPAYQAVRNWPHRYDQRLPHRPGHDTRQFQNRSVRNFTVRRFHSSAILALVPTAYARDDRRHFIVLVFDAGVSRL